ncbi:DUF86 domain-containing protein [Pseudactinotalea terrae]|uniref:HepT-like ribonuclease domain-containing protein n=1 Tax=Pseudactinotalea terrae TaxID=1743262 RepID=UPI001F500704|nr:HepT-like ribonuclease domain-containing protein [Pseudactinotalea terrae]
MSEDAAAAIAVGRSYGAKTLEALHEIVRITDLGMQLASRGHDWYTNDSANVPGLAAEALITKLGENVSRVSAPFEADHPTVPWKVIKDMRNRLTHYYEATDYDVVWSTIASDFPTINAMVRRLLGASSDDHTASS